MAVVWLPAHPTGPESVDGQTDRVFESANELSTGYTSTRHLFRMVAQLTLTIELYLEWFETLSLTLRTKPSIAHIIYRKLNHRSRLCTPKLILSLSCDPFHAQNAKAHPLPISSTHPAYPNAIPFPTRNSLHYQGDGTSEAGKAGDPITRGADAAGVGSVCVHSTSELILLTPSKLTLV